MNSSCKFAVKEKTETLEENNIPFNLVRHSDLYIPTPFFPAETDPPFCLPALNELNSLMARMYRLTSDCFLFPPLNELSG